MGSRSAIRSPSLPSGRLLLLGKASPYRTPLMVTRELSTVMVDMRTSLSVHFLLLSKHRGGWLQVWLTWVRRRVTNDVTTVSEPHDASRVGEEGVV